MIPKLRIHTNRFVFLQDTSSICLGQQDGRENKMFSSWKGGKYEHRLDLKMFRLEIRKMRYEIQEQPCNTSSRSKNFRRHQVGALTMAQDHSPIPRVPSDLMRPLILVYFAYIYIHTITTCHTQYQGNIHLRGWPYSLCLFWILEHSSLVIVNLV